MGDWGKSNYTYERERKRNLETGLKDKLSKFNGLFLKDRQTPLKEIFDIVQRDGLDLISVLGRGEKVWNGIKEVEIETKLIIPKLYASSKDAHYHAKFGWEENFAWANYNSSLETEHFFYGDDNGEVFSVINNPIGIAIKTKGHAVPYQLGIFGEEFVLRRDEALKDIIETKDHNSASVAAKLGVYLAEKCAQTNTHYSGTMKKQKSTSFILQRDSGRVYSAVFAFCQSPDKDELKQLEFEYVGSIPGYPVKRKVEDERLIVKDIVELSSLMQDRGFQPTRQTKYDWVVGKITP